MGEDLWLNWDEGLGELLHDDCFFDDLFASSLADGSVNIHHVASSPQKLASTPTNSEEKRQMKLHRNRLSAALSRQRKKSYMRDLEVKCKMLEARSEQLQRSLEYVNTENVLLKEELARLKGASRKSAIEPAVLEKGSLLLEFLSHLIRWCLWWGVPLLPLALLSLLGALLLLVLPLPLSAAAAVARGGALFVLSLGTPSAHVGDALPTRNVKEMKRWRPP